MPSHHTFSPAVVRATHDIARDVRLFEIEPADGPSPYQVGSHLDIQVFVDDRPQYRSFSLIGDTLGDGCYQIAVKSRPDGHGGSRYLWSLEPGARVRVSDPRDRFPLSHRANSYLLVAGGIGITPIYGMALALDRRGADFRLLYTARSDDQLAFAEELEARLGDRLEISLTGESERLNAEHEIARLASDTEIYICGPLGLRQDFLNAWLAAGRPQQQFRFETFASSGQFPDESFAVRVANHDIELTVARDQSLLQALQQHGVDDVLYDCEHGECGLCTVDVVACSGTLDHRDVFYSDRQKQGLKRICTCVSRVFQGDLTIDTSRHAVDTGRADP